MVLVFNCGSASLRWALFDENLNKVSGKRFEYPNFSNLPELTKKIIGNLVSPNTPNSPNSLTIVHRVVHGGSEFRKPTKVTDKVFTKLENFSQLAPLHNPPALEVIKTCRQELPNISNIACFDTSFFADLPDYAKYYALPPEITKKYQIQRYGFHGISHEYIAQEAAKQLNKSFEELQLITCHLGSGASITAIENGQPIDTSMGFTPLEGLMMATRSGNIDPAIPILLNKQGLKPEEIENILNRKSGLLGISGFSGDMRDIIEKSQSLDEVESLTLENSKEFDSRKSQKLRAGLALQMYAYQIKKYIGAYAVALGGLDALVFTGAVAEGSKLVRSMITHGLSEVLGRFETLIIPANEELAIAKKTLAFQK